MKTIIKEISKIFQIFPILLLSQLISQTSPKLTVRWAHPIRRYAANAFSSPPGRVGSVSSGDANAFAVNPRSRLPRRRRKNRKNRRRRNRLRRRHRNSRHLRFRPRCRTRNPGRSCRRSWRRWRRSTRHRSRWTPRRHPRNGCPIV